MRLTTMTDYAMRLLIYVGQRPERLCTIAEVAGAYAISQAHLMKVTHRLAQAGWLATSRGKGGGIRLREAPARINLGAVVRSVEPDFFVVECLATANACRLAGNCKLTGIMQAALQDFMQRLDRHTLADLLPERATGFAQERPVELAKRTRAALG